LDKFTKITQFHHDNLHQLYRDYLAPLFHFESQSASWSYLCFVAYR
jgi:hypothetical protein